MARLNPRGTKATRNLTPPAPTPRNLVMATKLFQSLLYFLDIRRASDAFVLLLLTLGFSALVALLGVSLIIRVFPYLEVAHLATSLLLAAIFDCLWLYLERAVHICVAAILISLFCLALSRQSNFRQLRALAMRVPLSDRDLVVGGFWTIAVVFIVIPLTEGLIMMGLTGFASLDTLLKHALLMLCEPLEAVLLKIWLGFMLAAGLAALASHFEAYGGSSSYPCGGLDTLLDQVLEEFVVCKCCGYSAWDFMTHLIGPFKEANK